MINNAKEARGILQKSLADWKDISTENANWEIGQAKGYLACLEGPEIKALVEALENIHKLITKEAHERMGCDEPCYCAIEFSELALSQYREAVKK